MQFIDADNTKAPAYYFTQLRDGARVTGTRGPVQYLFRFFKPDHVTCLMAARQGGEMVNRVVEVTAEEAGIPIKELIPLLWGRAPE